MAEQDRIDKEFIHRRITPTPWGLSTSGWLCRNRGNKSLSLDGAEGARGTVKLKCICV